MHNNMLLVTRILSLALAATLSIAAATRVNAAADVPPAPAASPASAASQPAQQLDELNEVWVRGKRLSEVIRKTEDEFFKAYNKVNRNHNYDVHCGEVLLDRTSLAMTRTCLPGFYVYNYLDLAGRAVPSCSTSTSSGDTDTFSGNSGYYTGCTYALLVPPALMAMEHREKYRKNVLQVIDKNEQLQTMASKLAGLYGEMEAVQNQYVKVRGLEQQPVQPVRKARKISTSAPSDTRAGPRSM